MCFAWVIVRITEQIISIKVSFKSLFGIGNYLVYDKLIFYRNELNTYEPQLLQMTNRRLLCKHREHY